MSTNGTDPIGARKRWPDPPEAAAYHGVAGDIVRAIEPHTEADPAAVLVQFLVCVGSAFGRGPGFEVEADRHGTNLFVALVGETAKGRKGTSFGQARRPVEVADSTGWSEERVLTGLSSGEGLIWNVRDAVVQRRKAKKSEREQADAEGYIEELIDEGVQDKRLFVYESELASVLGRMGRDGNSLSAVMRQAWDGGTLNALTKNSPTKATGAFVSIVGHITEDDLRKYLTATDMANGFANRFLWVCARRSKKLPHGGALHTVDWRPLTNRLIDALAFARSGQVGALPFDAEGAAAWEDAYEGLTEGEPGLLGAVTSRAEAQVRRLAVIYAVLDTSKEVRAEHLRAALAIWGYCYRSAYYLFGTALGDSLADRIEAALGDADKHRLERTEISNLLGRHVKAAEIDRALVLLESHGRATREKVPTNGRPAERWVLLSLTSLTSLPLSKEKGEENVQHQLVGGSERSEVSELSKEDEKDKGSEESERSGISEVEATDEEEALLERLREEHPDLAKGT